MMGRNRRQREREKQTILIPNMLPLHFQLFVKMFDRHGYDVRLLQNEGPNVVRMGLESVHNDTCYPALLVIGQFLDALRSGEYDLNNTALIITQTGGGCRASNYIHLLRKALKKNGLERIPVYSLNFSGLDGKQGFSLTLGMLRELLAEIALADTLMLLNGYVMPYEITKGDCQRETDRWMAKLKDLIGERGIAKRSEVSELMREMVRDFERIPVHAQERIKVGIVGEIYVKYASLANNHLVDFLMDQGCEVMVPGLMNFLIFKVDNRLIDIELYGGNPVKKAVCTALMNFLLSYEDAQQQALEGSRFMKPGRYNHLKELASRVIGKGCKMGEGWLLTAEAMEMVEAGYPNIVSVQPFSCLPNHIVTKGMARAVKEQFPQANIAAIDYDPGATRVNQENRIKLMLAMAERHGEAV